MSTDISKVYLFLAKQGGIEAADGYNNGNKDGVVIKSEFRSFMEDNFEWDGETTDAGKNDLINTFWNTIDTKQSGNIKTSTGRKLKNKNAIDKNELNALNNKIEMYEILNDFLEEVEVPNSVYDQSAWKKSLSDSLASFVEKEIKNGTKSDALLAKLQAELPAAKARTTADYVAQEYIEEVLSDIENYARGDDKVLKGVIDKYIAEIKKLGNDNLPTEEEIQTKVKELVDAYLSTANIGEGDATTLTSYGYAPRDKSPMNDLQKAVLLTEALNSVRTDATEKAKYDMSNDGYKAALNDFINSLNYGDFAKYQGNILEQFKQSTYYTTIQEKVDEANLAKVREDAIKYCDSLYKQGNLYKAAVDNIFGSDYAKAINEMDAETIESTIAQLKEAIAAYDISEMTDAEKQALLNGLADITVLQGENKTVLLNKVGSCNGNIITSERITYTYSGAVSVDSSGKVTYNTANPGTWSGTVNALIDGKIVASKTIIIKVNYNNSNLVNNISGTTADSAWGGNTTNLEVYGCQGVSDSTQLTSSNFSTLYNGGAVIQLYSGGTDGDWDEFGKSSTVTSRLRELTSYIGNILKSAGYDSSKLNTAIATVQKKYCNTKNWIAHKDRFEGPRSNYCANKINSGEYPSNTIVKQHDDIKSHKDKVVYMVSFKGLVDAILDEYNKLI